MINFLQQLFCWHKWINIDAWGFEEHSKTKYFVLKECKKCRKRITEVHIV